MLNEIPAGGRWDTSAADCEQRDGDHPTGPGARPERADGMHPRVAGSAARRRRRRTPDWRRRVEGRLMRYGARSWLFESVDRAAIPILHFGKQSAHFAVMRLFPLSGALQLSPGWPGCAEGLASGCCGGDGRHRRPLCVRACRRALDGRLEHALFPAALLAVCWDSFRDRVLDYWDRF